MGSSAGENPGAPLVVESTDLKVSFQQRGLIETLAVIDAERAAYYSAKLAEFVRCYQDHPSFPDWTYYKSYLLFTWIAQLAAEPALLDAIEVLIGPDIFLWDASLPLKRPRSSGYFGWHQDATYWPIEPLEHVVSAWVALSEVNRANGAVRMLPGSHRAGQLPHQKTFDATSMLRRGQQVAEPVDEAGAIDINLRSGEASLHHAFMLHGSGANQTDGWRLGVVLNFVAADVGPARGNEDSALLLRGKPGDSRFVLDSAPGDDLSPVALASYTRAVERTRSRYGDIPD